MTEELKVRLAVSEDGSIVHIQELDPETQRGLKCGCACAECGDRLIARLGDVRQHHFAHSTVQGCVRSDESALHRFAKEVFQRHHRFRVPEAEVWYEFESEKVCEAGNVTYREAILERPVGDVIPDITLVRDGKEPFLVEILVTHEVDGDKAAKLECLGLPCVEIDLSEQYERLDEFDRESIEDLVIAGDGREKQWVCIPGAAEHVERLRQRVEAQREAERLEREAERLKEQRKREWIAKTQAERNERRKTLLLPEHITAEALRKEEKWKEHPQWKRNSRILGISADNVPYYLNIPLDGEYLFTCHRIIWQSTVFISWVYNKRDQQRSRDIHVEFATKNLKKDRPELLEPDLDWAKNDGFSCLRLSDVLGRYFQRLCGVGYLERVGPRGDAYSWIFECRRSSVWRPDPGKNDANFVLHDDGVLNRETGEVSPLR